LTRRKSDVSGSNKKKNHVTGEGNTATSRGEGFSGLLRPTDLKKRKKIRAPWEGKKSTVPPIAGNNTTRITERKKEFPTKKQKKRKGLQPQNFRKGEATGRTRTVQKKTDPEVFGKSLPIALLGGGKGKPHIATLKGGGDDFRLKKKKRKVLMKW